MIKRNLLLQLALLTALFLLSRNIWAQSGHYVIEQRYVQQIYWTEDEYVFKYEVTVEWYADGEYRAYSQEFTDSNSIQISLPPGNYRYRVIPYDFLDQPGEATDWIKISIKPASDEMVKAALKAETKKQVSIFVNAAWTPSFPIYGKMQEVYGNEFYAPGAIIRLGLFFFKMEWFDFGAEMTTSWYELNTSQGGVKIDLQAGITNLNVIAQMWFNKNMAITVRTGGGIVYQAMEISGHNDDYSKGSATAEINLEASFLLIVYKQFYLESGACYTFFWDKDKLSVFFVR